MNVSREQYDTIVIGVGSMGNTAVYRLAERSGLPQDLHQTLYMSDCC